MKILNPSKDDGDTNGGLQKISNKNLSDDQKTPVLTNVTGNFNNSNEGIVTKAINLIENEVFFSDQESVNEQQGHHIIQDALVYLKYSAYK